jgi:hypothetical protein
MSAAVKLQRAFEREQAKSTASRDRADQAKAEFEKEWKAKQEKEKKGVEEDLKSKMAAATLAAANLLGSPAQAAEEPVKPITIAYVTIGGEVKKYNLGDIPYKYNLMATYINKNLSYKKLDEVDKAFVNENVDKLLPKLQSLNQLAQEYQFLDAFLVPRIIENIQSRQFNTLIDLPEIQSKIKSFTELEIKPHKAPAKPASKPAEPQTPAKRGRPSKYATPEEAYQAKLESTARSKQRAKERDKQASKVKTPAQAEVEATEPTEGNIMDDYEEQAVLDMLIEQHTEKLDDYERETNQLAKKALLKEVQSLEDQIEAIDPEYFD